MSVLGVGVDIVFLPDFAKAMKKQEFMKRVFSAKEIRFCKSKAFPLQHFAARFAAKEATFKAIEKPVSYLQVEIRTSASGKPSIAFLPQKQARHPACQISMAHVKDYALAFVICTKQ
ncbi:MAG: holo-ACP synthase [Parcubacteria group bacterium]|nr:holo-ACP synthase [Parcubacteria group bacterium]